MIIGGAQFAMTPGISTMLTWCAGSLVSQKLPKPFVVPIMARDLVPSGWMTWPAQEVSRTLQVAVTVDGESMTVLTVKMPVWSVLLQFLELAGSNRSF